MSVGAGLGGKGEGIFQQEVLSLLGSGQGVAGVGGLGGGEAKRNEERTQRVEWQGRE